MKRATLDKLIWTLIYGGLFAVALGLAVRRAEPVLGWVMVASGVVAALAGAALVVVRSRLPDNSQESVR
jgi:membrane associated rhomboid family serine protease